MKQGILELALKHLQVIEAAIEQLRAIGANQEAKRLTERLRALSRS
jgi:hypothetical protein